MSAPNATFNMSGHKCDHNWQSNIDSHLLAEDSAEEAEDSDEELKPKSICSPKQNMDYRNSRMETVSTVKRAKRKFDCLAKQHKWRSEKMRNMAEDPEQQHEFFTRAEILEMRELGPESQKHINYAYAQMQVKKYEQCKCYKCLQTNKIIDKSGSFLRLYTSPVAHEAMRTRHTV